MDKLYSYKYELFLGSQIAILFGSLFFTADLFSDYLSSLFFYLNIVAGTLIINTNRNIYVWITVTFLPFIIALPVFFNFGSGTLLILNYSRLIFLFGFHAVVTFSIVKQVWKVELVNKTVLLGLVSGFISLGLIGFFICISIEIDEPGSFSGIYKWDYSPEVITDRLMYFSYITLLTIGFGDIVPVTHLAQKATILIGLSGQFYLVIFTALILEKYIRQNKK